MSSPLFGSYEPSHRKESSIKSSNNKREKKHSLTRVLFVFLDIFFLSSLLPSSFLFFYCIPHTGICASPLAKNEMYCSYLKISFSFIVANPTILHRYKCLCSVSDIRAAHIYALYLLYLVFFLKPPSISSFFASMKNVVHHSMME